MSELKISSVVISGNDLIILTLIFFIFFVLKLNWIIGQWTQGNAHKNKNLGDFRGIRHYIVVVFTFFQCRVSMVRRK